MQQESKRQLQVAKLLEKELNTIFQKIGLSIVNGALISIYKVQVTPDLLECRTFLSVYGNEDKQAALDTITSRSGEIRKELGNSLRHQLRRIPTLDFRLDETLDYVFKMEEVFKNLNAEKNNDEKKED